VRGASNQSGPLHRHSSSTFSPRSSPTTTTSGRQPRWPPSDAGREPRWTPDRVVRQPRWLLNNAGGNQDGRQLREGKEKQPVIPKWSPNDAKRKPRWPPNNAGRQPRWPPTDAGGFSRMRLQCS